MITTWCGTHWKVTCRTCNKSWATLPDQPLLVPYVHHAGLCDQLGFREEETGQ